jgi:hypothetical protein
MAFPAIAPSCIESGGFSFGSVPESSSESENFNNSKKEVMQAAPSGLKMVEVSKKCLKKEVIDITDCTGS